MADTDNTIACTSVELFGTMHTGDVLPILPIGGFTGSSHHDIVAPTAGYKIGSKVRYYDPSAKGWVTMVYVRFGVPSAIAFRAGSLMGVETVGNNASLYTHRVTNDPDELLIPKGGMGCVGISAVTTLYYGWAWEAGVCPQVARAGCSELAAASLDTYWDVTSVTGAYIGVLGNGFDIDAAALIAADDYNQMPFAICKVICSVTGA